MENVDGLRPYARAWGKGIRQVMYRNTIPFRFAGAVRGPQVFVFRLWLEDAAQLGKTLGLGEQYALRMGVERVRVARQRGLVDVEVALPAEFHKALPCRALEQRGGTWVTLGKTASGTPVRVDLAGDRTSQALISGTTGCGKTVTQQFLAYVLASGNEPGEVRLVLIDGKGGVRWRGFYGAVHLAHPVIGDVGEAVAAFAWATAELDRRGRTGQTRPRTFLVVDEVARLIERGGPALGEAISTLTMMGRELGIHVVLGTQYPVADALGGMMAKANLPLRLVGRVLSASEAYVATGVKGSGAEFLSGGGDFLVTAGGRSVRLQMGMATLKDLYHLPRTNTPHRLALDEYNLDRALSVVGDPGSRRSPMEPDHLALALATNRGETWLARRLGIGGSRAGRLRKFAVRVLASLERLGYRVVTLHSTGEDGGENVAQLPAAV